MESGTRTVVERACAEYIGIASAFYGVSKPEIRALAARSIRVREGGWACEPVDREVVAETSLNEWERALVGNDNGETAQIKIGLGRVVQSRADLYGYKLPSPQELRHNRAIANLIDGLTEGQGSELRHSNPSEWNCKR
jgi:hypothetical protein